MSATTQAVSAIDSERALVEEVGRANTARLDAQRESARLAADIVAAQRARTDAVREQIRGTEGAGKRLAAASQAIESATRRKLEADERIGIALTLANDATTRLAQLRSACLAELAQAMGPLVDDYREQQRTLDTGLHRLSDLHDAIARRCRELEGGCRARVEQLDSERGQRRSDAKVSAESKPPVNPLPPAVLSAIVNGSPLPMVLRDGYAPGEPQSVAPVDDGGLDLIFPGDSRHQKSTGPGRAEVAEAVEASARRRVVTS
jgi:hypothetical protein